MSDDKILSVESRGAIDFVTLNRPGRLNALNHPMAEALLEYFESRRRRADVRVIVLAGAGRAFCAGADLKAGGTPEALRDGPNGDWTLRDLVLAMRACPQPIVCLVQGAAAGGGMALAVHSDIVLAGESAAFHPAFMKIGLSGTELGVGWRLQRSVGQAVARDILLTGRPVDAAEAKSIGLVARVVPDAELAAAGAATAEAMLAASPDALRVTKRSLDATLQIPDLATALEVEERGQMHIIRQGRAAAAG